MEIKGHRDFGIGLQESAKAEKVMIYYPFSIIFCLFFDMI